MGFKGKISKGGYCVGNTQFFIIVGRVGYFFGNTQFCIIAEKLYVIVWFYDWILYICTYGKRSRQRAYRTSGQEVI